MYESSMLCGFAAADDEGFITSGFTTGGAAGPGTAEIVETDCFGFTFGAAVSLLTRTDAGT